MSFTKAWLPSAPPLLNFLSPKPHHEAIAQALDTPFETKAFGYVLVVLVDPFIYVIYGPGLQAPPPTPPQRVWVHRFLYVGGTRGLPPAP